jgi:hypothetical protein
VRSNLELLEFSRGEHLGESSFLKSEVVTRSSGELVPDRQDGSSLNELFIDGDGQVWLDDFLEWLERLI